MVPLFFKVKKLILTTFYSSYLSFGRFGSLKVSIFKPISMARRKTARVKYYKNKFLNYEK